MIDDYDDDTFAVFLDNDVFFTGNDRGYTNGTRFSWISKNYEKSNLPPFFEDLTFLVARDTVGMPGIETEGARYNYGFSLTQLIFTPENFNALTPPEGERQYAGWTGIGMSIHAKNEHTFNSMELTIGTTGEPSLAEGTQKVVHSFIESNDFMGWDSQVPAELTINLHSSQKYRLGANWDYTGLGIDGYTEWGGSLGNFRTDLYAGLFLRAGYNLSPEFSDPRLSVNSYSHRLFNAPNAREPRKFSVFTFGGIRTSLVAYDITLDGPLFRDWKSYNTREPYVREMFYGIGIRLRKVDFVFAQVNRSQEFKQDKNTHEIFGATSIRFAY